MSKHGLDFEEAKQIWADPNRLEAPARIVEGEERSVMIGQLADKIWTAVFTRREGRIRIISVRRARKNEEEAYGGKADNS